MTNERKGGSGERQTASQRIYDGKILSLRVDNVQMPSGRVAKREVVEHKHAVGVLALNEDGVLLVRQYRYAVGEEMLEICAGLIEDGEEPRAAAEREMQEELGFKAKSLVQIGSFYATPGFCTEFMTLFLAEGLTPSRLPQDEDEDVSLVDIPFAALPRLLSGGGIRDAKTFAAIAWLMAWKGMKP